MKATELPILTQQDLCPDPLQWRHNGRDSVSNHQPHDCLLNRLFRRRSKKTSKLRVTGLCAGNSPGTGEFPAQMACYAENVSIWWRHHAMRPPVPLDILHWSAQHTDQTRHMGTGWPQHKRNYGFLCFALSISSPTQLEARGSSK